MLISDVDFMCNLPGFDLIWFLILQKFMEFMEMQHALVVNLIEFLGTWAIVLGQSCYPSAEIFGYFIYSLMP